MRLLIRQVVQHLLHFLLVFPEGSTTSLGKMNHCLGFLSIETFLDGEKTAVSSLLRCVERFPKLRPVWFLRKT
jgi:hypothetical protein